MSGIGAKARAERQRVGLMWLKARAASHGAAAPCVRRICP
jgi:hypothetical protein